MSAVMATMLFECALVIGVDVSAEKLALASSLGATHIIDAAASDPVDEIRALTGGRGVDFAVDASGLTRVIEQAFDSVRRGGGVCLFASHPAHSERIKIDPYELICGKSIRGSWGGSSEPDRDIPLFANLYREGKLPLHKLLTRRYRLEDVNGALNDLEHGAVGRALIELDPSVGSAT